MESLVRGWIGAKIDFGAVECRSCIHGVTMPVVGEDGELSLERFMDMQPRKRTHYYYIMKYSRAMRR